MRAARDSKRVASAGRAAASGQRREIAVEAQRHVMAKLDARDGAGAEVLIVKNGKIAGALGGIVDLARDPATALAADVVQHDRLGYVFAFTEAVALTLQRLAMQLAKATVAGAGALAETAEDPPEQLRINVTSPNGTTQAGLEVLMDAGNGLPPLMERTVAAAADRSRALRHGG